LYDAIVVGSRCAGASTAIFLAQKGYRVLLLDRAVFPSPTICTHVFGDSEIFERMGVWDKIHRAGGSAMTRMRVDVEGCVLEADLVLFTRSIGLRREILDTILAEHAASLPNVEWRQGMNVTDLVIRDGVVEGVEARGRDNRRHRFYGRVVIGADGRGSLVARRTGAEVYLEAEPVRCAYYAYFEGLHPLGTPTVEWYWWSPDIVFVTPCGGNLHTALIMPPQVEFHRWRRDPAHMLDTRLRRIRTLAPRLANARRVGPVRGLGNIGSRVRRSYGPGWALVGDAGAHLHPVTGSGIENAVAAAELLAEALHQVFSGQASWEEALSAYQDKRDGLIMSQFHGAQRLLNRGPVSPEAVGWLSLLSTLPGVVHDLAARSREVLELLMGKEKAAPGEPLVRRFLARQSQSELSPVRATAR